MRLPARRVGSEPSRGFTVVELITILAIIAVLAAFAAPRFFDSTAFDARGYADEIAAALRLSRAAAVGSGCRVRVQIDAGSYSAAQQPAASGHCDAGSASFTTPVRAPDGRSVAGTAPNGVTASPALAIVFDAQGRAASGGDTNVTVGGTHTLRVEAGSGMVRGP